MVIQYIKEIKIFQTTNLITNFKIIIKESNVEYEDVVFESYICPIKKFYNNKQD